MSTAEYVTEFARVTEQEGSKELYDVLIKEEYIEFCEAVEPDHKLKELADLIYVIYGYAGVRGWDLDGAIQAVHKNNVGRCLQPDGSILRRDDGKIIKNKDYPSVNLKEFIYNEL